MRYLYSILFYLYLPFVFLRLLWRSRNAPDYRHRWFERLGFCPFQLSQSIVVHAVSLGETIAAAPLIKALQKQYPHLPIVVTNMTPTGSARVKSIFKDSVLNCYMPYDVPGAVKRFLNQINPLLIVVMETELWPNLIAECAKREIPLIITNARLSEKSAEGYRKFASLTREMLQNIRQIAAQSQADADRFISLGMPVDRIKVTGNIKFDIELADDLVEKSAALRDQLGKRLIWIAASTHPGEDEIILAAHKSILAKFPEALLILVPRHPERFDAMATFSEQQGFKVARRSKAESCTPETQVYLADTMGEMMLMYSVCDVACVAGSFVAVGGHNMLEPAVLHKPIVMGPQLFNFAEISDMMIKANGLLIVNNANELAETVVKLFADDKYRKTIGENAYSIIDANRGALQRQMVVIKGA